MSAYIIAQIRVTDPEQYARYAKRAPDVIAKYGGRFIVRGGQTTVLEGPSDTRRVVVIEFPSIQQAEAFYHSREYRDARKLRENAAEASFILVEGWPS